MLTLNFMPLSTSIFARSGELVLHSPLYDHFRNISFQLKTFNGKETDKQTHGRTDIAPLYFLSFSTFFTYSVGAKKSEGFFAPKKKHRIKYINYIRNHMYIGKAETPRTTSCYFESCTQECI